MIVVILCAVMTIVMGAWLVHPLMIAGKGKDAKSPHRRAGYIILGVLAVSALALYLLRGMPDLPMDSAALETAGPRAEQRALLGQELAYMEALSTDPQNARLLLALGAIRLQAGRVDDALAALHDAQALAPDDKDIALELGAAYYAQALTHLTNDGASAHVLSSMKNALEIAPQDAPYRAQLEKQFKALSTTQTP